MTHPRTTGIHPNLARPAQSLYASPMPLLIVQIVYWLALATWFGGVLFVTIAAPVILNTLRDSKLILPTVLSVNLENQHATLLGGSIVANLVERLSRIEVACAIALALAIVAQWASLWRSLALPGVLVPANLRTALFLAAVAFAVYHSRVLWPRLMAKRQAFLDHADEPEVANPAKDEFDRYQRESVTILMIQVALLLGMILFSAGIPVNTGTLTARFD